MHEADIFGAANSFPFRPRRVWREIYRQQISETSNKNTTDDTKHLKACLIEEIYQTPTEKRSISSVPSITPSP
jgi:hypothetical protein